MFVKKEDTRKRDGFKDMCQEDEILRNQKYKTIWLRVKVKDGYSLRPIK